MAGVADKNRRQEMTTMLKTTALIPPQDLEAEQAVLGTILLHEKIISGLTADIFYRDSHRKIFSAMLNLFSQESAGKVDVVLLTNYLRDCHQLEEIGGAVYLATLTSCIPLTSGKADQYAEIIRRKAALRKIIAASQETAQLSYAEQGDVKNILAQNQRQMDEVAKILGMMSSRKMDADIDHLLQSFVVRETHLKCLNKSIGGLPNDVIVIGGQSSMGKTSLSLGFLQQLAIQNRQRVAYFGSGVSREELYMRLLCMMCRINPTALRRGNVDRNQRKKLADALRIINDSPLSPFTVGEKMSTVDISVQIRALVKEYGEDMGVIIIENLQQLFWPEKFNSRKEEIDVIIEHLKALAINQGIPIIISSQVKREVSEREDKRARPTDLSGSSDIESLARLVIMLYWDDYFHPKKGQQDSDNSVDAEIAIYKGGRPTILHLKFNPTYFIWED